MRLSSINKRWFHLRRCCCTVFTTFRCHCHSPEANRGWIDRLCDVICNLIRVDRVTLCAPNTYSERSLQSWPVVLLRQKSVLMSMVQSMAQFGYDWDTSCSLRRAVIAVFTYVRWIALRCSNFSQKCGARKPWRCIYLWSWATYCREPHGKGATLPGLTLRMTCHRLELTFARSALDWRQGCHSGLLPEWLASALGHRVEHGAIFQTQSNSVHKYLVLMLTFNRGKTGIVKRS